MAGLNNIISNTAQQTTTLPSWFDTAQQNVVSQAGQVAAGAPTPQQTVAQNAVNQLSGPTNAFTNAANTLQGIASGAANPWIVTPSYSQSSQPNWAAMRSVDQGTQDTFGGADGNNILPVGDHPLGMPDMGDGNRMNANLPAMGGALGGVGSEAQGYNIAPNPNTALGGLFAAQNQQLQQLAPNIMAPVTAGGTGSGQFGSLRTQTAADKALADAQAQLFAQQMQAALTNQATGVNAAQGVGNVTQQDINNLLTVGQYQQASPFANVSNYGKILGGIQAPTTVSNQTQLSPLNQVAGVLAALGGTGAGTGILNSLGVSGLTGLLNSVKDWYNTSSANQTMSDVNTGVLAPDAGGTPYVPLPGIDSSTGQGEVG